MAFKNTINFPDIMIRIKSESGLSQREIGKNIGCSQGRISEILAGDRRIAANTFIEYMKACGYEVLVHKTGSPAGADLYYLDEKGDWRKRQENPSERFKKKQPVKD